MANRSRGGRPTWYRSPWAWGSAALVLVVGVLSGIANAPEDPPAAVTTPTSIAAPAPSTAPSTTPSTAPSTTPTPTPSPAASEQSAAPASPVPTATAFVALTGWPYDDVDAHDAVADLTVKGRAAKTGYDRDLFGAGWVDVDRNGCDTRNDVLAAQLAGVVTAGGCKVTEGELADPYTGEQIVFVPGSRTPVHIDHVVALSDAWQKGAQKWAWEKRVAFANDPLNLLAVDASTNMSKGDGDAATWLPPNKAFRCEYVSRQVAVKLKYEVAVTQPEKDAMLRVLETCPGQPLAAAGDQPTKAANTGGAEPGAKPDPDTTPDVASGDGADPDFGTCKAAKAAGYGPYVQGADAEYDYYIDRDRDGVVCE